MTARMSTGNSAPCLRPDSREPETHTVIGYPEACSFVIDFSIPNFSSLKTQTTALYSDAVTMCEADWKIGVWALKKAEAKSGELKTNANWVALSVETTDHNEDFKYEVRYAISVMEFMDNGIDQKIYHEVKGHRIFKAEDPGCSIPKFIKHSDIWGRNPTLVLPDDTLHLRAKVQFFLTDEAKSRSSVADSLRGRMLSIFSLDFGRDFVLVSSDGTELPGHKVFLNAASPVFRNMFAANLEECKIGRCVISDISPKTLQAFLRYVYYGCVEYTKEIAEGLLVAADKYDLLCLKEHCESVLVSEVDMESVAGLLALVSKVEAPKLKKAALGCLAENYTEALASGTIDAILKSGDMDLIKDLMAAMLEMGWNANRVFDRVYDRGSSCKREENLYGGFMEVLFVRGVSGTAF